MSEPVEVEFPYSRADEVAEAFHDSYERLAPDFGYETNPETAKPWLEIPRDNPNRRLMTATVADLLERGIIQ